MNNQWRESGPTARAEELLVLPDFLSKNWMVNVVFSEKAKAMLVALAGLLLAMFVGVNIGSSDYTFVLFVFVFAVGLFLWFGMGQWFWLLTIASSYLGGTFPILGGSFTPFQLLMTIGVAKFFVEDIILRRKALPRLEAPLLIALAGLIAVVTVHAVHDRFGVRFFGSNIWGGRNYINIYVGLAAFFVVQSTAVKNSLWNKLPYLILAVTTFDLIIALVTAIFPASINKIYPFYSAVSLGGLTELVNGQEEITGRVGNFGNFGWCLGSIILAATPVPQLLNPRRLFRLAGMAMASLAVLASGFRSALANLGCTVLIAGYRDLRWGMLALLPLIAALLFALSAFNSVVIPLPKQMQRALTFLPGDWDTDMTLNATASDDFRQQAWTLWLKEFFPAHPLLGRGFGFPAEWAAPSTGKTYGTDIKQMVETGNIHNGLFASLDAVGIIGTIFFIAWALQILTKNLQIRFDPADPTGFALRFLALQIGTVILGYWIGAVTLGTFLPQQFALTGVFLRLSRDRAESNQEATNASLTSTQRQPLARV